MNKKVKIAGVQMEPKILDKERNLEKCLEKIQVAARRGARLIVLPECALTGYCFSSLEEALPVVEPIPGPSTREIKAACEELNVYVVVGLLEKHVDKYYNTAVLLGPNPRMRKHRKLHRPRLGIDRFLDDGDLPLRVYKTDVGNIGMGICYDMMFAEHSRVLALRGADILVFPANWPKTGQVYPKYIVPTRAIENRVFCVAVNRVGEERGTEFPGGSKIVDWFGRSLAKGKRNEDDILYADIEPAQARRKHYVIDRGEHEVNFIKDRKPEFYCLVCRGKKRKDSKVPLRV